MRIIQTTDGHLAVQGFTGPRGRVQCAGHGKSRLEAMAACGDLVAALDAEQSRAPRTSLRGHWDKRHVETLR